jgi:RNA polymerase sigma-70 factor (ECF subfamily)
MGGPNERFLTTDWTMILRAQTCDEDARRAALGELAGRYWKPVYCFLRRKGNTNEEAKDLTQGFFEEVVLGGGWVRQADSARGRFRNFLSRSLDMYARGVHRARTSKRRRPDKGLVPLEGLESFNVPEPASDVTPEEIFHYNWAAALLEQVVEDVKRQCADFDEMTHWKVFCARVLTPTMEGSPPPSMAELCDRYGITSTAKASNMIVTVKRRFRAGLVRHVRPLVGSDAEVDEEIRDLMRILSRSGAGF